MPRINTAVLLCCCALQACAPAADEAWSLWERRDADSTYRVDHDLWQSFLGRYVFEQPDGINRLAYTHAAGAGGGELLRTYIAAMTALDPRSLNGNEQLAYWINLYNALTVDLILRHPRVTTILDIDGGVVASGPWDRPLARIAGQPVTLNDIEHRILRPIWRDHRIHYALNCASLGCPNLNRTAFRSDNIEQLLDGSERDFVNHPRAVHLNPRGQLRVSSLFDWYRTDFAADETQLVAYLAAHHTALRTALENYSGDIDYHYDWTLNALIADQDVNSLPNGNGHSR